MKPRFVAIVTAVFSSAIVIAEQADDRGWMDDFPVAERKLVSTGKNAYWRLNPGRYVVLGALAPGGGEFVLITVLKDTEMVDGTETRVIEEREYENGKLVEVSRNFFAMDRKTGDVFYFGEDVDDYADGKIVGHDGQWRAGRDRARAGLYMPGEPVVGMRYYMELHPGVAMDRAEIFETDAFVETPAGDFGNALIVTESSPLEPGDESYKRYAPGVGMIFDDGLELYTHGRKFPSEKYVEFEIAEADMPTTAARLVRQHHPAGEIREVKVELHPDIALYAVETFVDGKQWDVLVTDYGETISNTPD